MYYDDHARPHYRRWRYRMDKLSVITHTVEVRGEEGILF